MVAVSGDLESSHAVVDLEIHWVVWLDQHLYNVEQVHVAGNMESIEPFVVCAEDVDASFS